MLKKLSIKTNFILIGIIIGLFVGVSIRQALGDTTSVPGTVRADNLTVNTSGQYTNGLIVANGNMLVPNGKIGIGTVAPSEALTVTGKVLSSGGFCINDVCVTKWDDLKTLLGVGGGAADPFAAIKTFISTSPTGPWLNDPVCREGKVYVRVTGVNKSNPPKGCATPAAASSDCLNISKHRNYTAEQWVDNTTIQSVMNGTDLPAGNYDFYLSYGSVAKKVGSGSIKSCAAAYEWVCGAVFGPSAPILDGYTCNANNVGKTINVPTTGGGARVDCTCKIK